MYFIFFFRKELHLMKELLLSLKEQTLPNRVSLKNMTLQIQPQMMKRMFL